MSVCLINCVKFFREILRTLRFCYINDTEQNLMLIKICVACTRNIWYVTQNDFRQMSNYRVKKKHYQEINSTNKILNNEHHLLAVLAQLQNKNEKSNMMPHQWIQKIRSYFEHINKKSSDNRLYLLGK